MKYFIPVFLFFFLLLHPAYAQAEFYVIGPGGRMAVTEIKSLPYTVSNPGFYYITKNLTAPENSNGITINSSDVTLDLMGFTLTGAGTGLYNGINVSAENVEIRNGSITTFPRFGIYSEVMKTCTRVLNIKAHNNGSVGFALASNSCLVRDCSSYSNGGDGMNVNAYTIVENCITHNNTGNGISSYSDTIIRGNLFHNNTESVLFLAEKHQ